MHTHIYTQTHTHTHTYTESAMCGDLYRNIRYLCTNRGILHKGEGQSHTSDKEDYNVLVLVTAS